MKRELFIAAPAYGNNVTAGNLSSMFVLGWHLAERGIETSLNQGTSSSNIVNGRNALAWQFLQSEATDLLWIDSDMAFSPAHFDRLWDSGLPISACIYPKKALNFKKAIASGNLNDLLEYVADHPVNGLEPTDGWLETTGIGFGYALVKREVIEAVVDAEVAAGNVCIEAQAPMSGADVAGIHDHLKIPWGEGRQRGLSEDFAFWHRARALGYKVMFDTTLAPLVHEGSYRFGEMNVK